MSMTKNLKALKEELLEVRRRIVVRRLVLEYLRLQSDRYTAKSDLGWLFSIAANAAGTVVAVLNGMRAGQYSGEATVLERELVELLVDKKLLEHRIAEHPG